MSATNYCAISGGIFCLVALAHLIRIVSSAAVTVDGYDVPMYLSWFAVIVPAALAFWAFRLTSRAA